MAAAGHAASMEANGGRRQRDASHLRFELLQKRFAYQSRPNDAD
jgi:hypothetical protein